MTAAFFVEQGVYRPDLCARTTAAVGFAVSVYWYGLGGPDAPKTVYQVMRWDDRPGPGKAFWDWYLWSRRQFYPTPELAAEKFVAAYRRWQEKGHRRSAVRHRVNRSLAS